MKATNSAISACQPQALAASIETTTTKSRFLLFFHRGNSHNRDPDHANLIGDALKPSHNFGGVNAGKQAERKDQDQWSWPTERQFDCIVLIKAHSSPNG